jgi:hypothetical protein
MRYGTIMVVAVLGAFVAGTPFATQAQTTAAGDRREDRERVRRL